MRKNYIFVLTKAKIQLTCDFLQLRRRWQWCSGVSLNESINVHICRLTRPHYLRNQTSNGISSNIVGINFATCSTAVVVSFIEMNRKQTLATATRPIVCSETAHIWRCG